MAAALLIFGICLLYFLFTLTLYLRGSMRDQIAGVVAVVMLIGVGFAFFHFGWKLGLAAVAVPLVFVNLARPLTSKLAYKILGFRTGLQDNGGSRAVQRFMSRRTSAVELFDELEVARWKIRRQLEALAGRPPIRAVLARHGLSVESLEELYEFMVSCGLQDIAIDIIGDPKRLEKAVTLRKDVVSYDGELRFAAEMREWRR